MINFDYSNVAVSSNMSNLSFSKFSYRSSLVGNSTNNVKNIATNKYIFYINIGI